MNFKNNVGISSNPLSRIRKAVYNLEDNSTAILAILSTIICLLLLFRFLSATGIFEAGDNDFPIVPNNPFSSVGAWDTGFLGFDSTSNGIPNLSYFFLIYAIYSIVRSPSLTQDIFYFLIFFVGMFSITVLVTKLFKDTLASVTAIFTYVLIPWTAMRLTTPSLLQSYFCMPVLLFSIYAYLETPRCRYLLIEGVSILFILGSLQMLYLIAIASLLLIIIFVLGKHPRNPLLALRRIPLLFLIPVLTSSYFVIPFVYTILTHSNTAISVAATNMNMAFYSLSTYHTIPNSIRMLGFIYADHSQYQEPVYLAIFVLPILAVLAIVGIRRSELVPVVLGALLLILGVFLSSPLEFLRFYSSVRNNIPLMSSFTEPDYFVPLIALSYSILISSLIHRFTKRKVIAIGLTLVVIISSISAVAIYQGQVKQAIPSEYSSLRQTLNDPDYSVFMAPTSWVMQFSWNQYSTDGLQLTFSQAPLVGPTLLEISTVAGRNYAATLDEYFSSNQTQRFAALAPFAAIGYLVALSNVVGVNTSEVENTVSTIAHQMNAQLELNSSLFSAYRIDNYETLPNLYETRNVICTNSSPDLISQFASVIPGWPRVAVLNDLAQISNQAGLNVRMVYVTGQNETINVPASDEYEIYTTGQQHGSFLRIDGNELVLNTSSDAATSQGRFLLSEGVHSIELHGIQVMLESKNSASVSDDRSPLGEGVWLSESQVQTQVENSTAPFVLVLSQSYSAQWVAQADGISIRNHFNANWFANAWLVTKTGSYNLSLLYYPENLRNDGLVLSGITLLVVASLATIEELGIRHHFPLMRKRPPFRAT